MNIIKRLAVCLVTFSMSLTLWAQRERNYIYILDCSNSMVSTYHIWDPTLEFLEKDIAKLSENSMVTIIPFQGTVYEKSVRHCKKSDFKWDAFKKEVYNFPKTLTGTNICSAWDEALKYVNPNKDNYIYLLTDGRDNKNPSPDGTDKVCQRIHQWCESVKNSRGYFIMLSQEAADPRIKSAVDQCSYMYWTDASKELKPFGSFENEEYSYNTLEPETVNMPFSAEGDYKVSVRSLHPNFNLCLDEGVVHNGKASLQVNSLSDMSSLPQYIDVPFVVSSPDVDILNDTMVLHIKNLPERSLKLPSEELDLGESEYYDAFWWSDAKPLDTLTIDLKACFNDAAVNAGSEVKIVVKETTDNHETEDQFRYLYNGKACAESFLVKAGDSSLLSIVPQPNAENGKHYFEISVVPNSVRNLENINQQHPADYVNTLRLEHDVRMNPLKLFLICLLIIIGVLLIIWFVFAKPFLYPKIKVKSVQLECEPMCRTVKIKGCRKVAFSNKKQSQSLLNYLFTGEVKYVKDDCWDASWYIVPTTKKDCLKAMGVSGYAVNPPSNTFISQNPVQMKSVATGKNIIVTIK